MFLLKRRLLVASSCSPFLGPLTGQQARRCFSLHANAPHDADHYRTTSPLGKASSPSPALLQECGNRAAGRPQTTGHRPASDTLPSQAGRPQDSPPGTRETLQSPPHGLLKRSLPLSLTRVRRLPPGVARFGQEEAKACT